MCAVPHTSYNTIVVIVAGEACEDGLILEANCVIWETINAENEVIKTPLTVMLHFGASLCSDGVDLKQSKEEQKQSGFLVPLHLACQ